MPESGVRGPGSGGRGERGSVIIVPYPASNVALTLSLPPVTAPCHCF